MTTSLMLPSKPENTVILSRHAAILILAHCRWSAKTRWDQPATLRNHVTGNRQLQASDREISGTDHHPFTITTNTRSTSHRRNVAPSTSYPINWPLCHFPSDIPRPIKQYVPIRDSPIGSGPPPRRASPAGNQDDQRRRCTETDPDGEEDGAEICGRSGRQVLFCRWCVGEGGG
jgi:hypothetical protein